MPRHIFRIISIPILQVEESFAIDHHYYRVNCKLTGICILKFFSVEFSSINDLLQAKYEMPPIYLVLFSAIDAFHSSKKPYTDMKWNW